MIAGAAAIALSVWWTSNTIAHLLIHRAFFRRRWANTACAAALSVVSGVPQPLWRARHLAHHAGVPPRLRLTRELTAHLLLVGAAWSLLLHQAPAFFVFTYLPGYACGLLLCALHGHYEHAGGTTSCYGAVYNALTFNDGFHAEHHANPSLSWRQLPARRDPAARVSRWPAPVRWIEDLRECLNHADANAEDSEVRSRNVFLTGLEILERLVLRSPMLQRFMLQTHERALGGLLGSLPPARRVAIVGGGLYPRTALVLRRLLPTARLTVIDANRENLQRARTWFRGDELTFVHARFEAPAARAFDLIVFPLAFAGNRAALYADPPAPAVIVHDWLWHKRGTSRIVSLALLKRVNAVRRERT
jgi:hypothetical protein